MKKAKKLRKKHRIKKKKPILENNFFGGFFIFLFLILGSTYLFVFHPFFQVDSISFTKKGDIDEDLLSKIIDKQIEKNWFFLDSKSIFLISGKDIEKNITEEVSLIEDIEVIKSFPSEIIIRGKSRTPFAIWCSRESEEYCHYVDRNGVLFSEIEIFIKDFVVYVEEKEASFGEKIISKDMINSLYSMKEKIQKEGLNLSYFKIHDERKIEAITKKGMRIYFSKEQEKMEAEMANFNITINSIEEEDRNNIDYIDLRFGDRIFYYKR